MKKLTNEELADCIKNLATFLDDIREYSLGQDVANLIEAAERLRNADEARAGIRAVYEKYKHIKTLSDRKNFGYLPTGQMFYDFWKAIKTEVEEAVNGPA